MKITDPQIIRQGEQDLIHSVQEDLDLDAVRKILKERMSVAALSSKGGQIVVHNNQIAFRLDFEVNLSGSLLFDRDGNYISESPGHGEGSAGASPLILDREEEILTGEDFTDDDLYDSMPDDGGHPSGPVPEEDDLDLDEELELAADELSLDDLDEEDERFMEDEGLDLEEESGFEDVLDDDDENPFEDDEDMDAQDLDDDINDILKESREFWEQKKES